MAKTSIHVVKVKGSSEQHNHREKELDYVRKELTPQNESFEVCSIPERLEQIKKKYQETTKQKMQSKATPIREGVIIIEHDTDMEQLKYFSKKCKEKFGIEAIQIHVHRDEGHYDKEKNWKPNLHAHIVFDWTDPNTGKSRKLNKFDTSEMQTILAECLQMDRGESSDKKHLNSIQFKIEKETENLNNILTEFHQTRSKVFSMRNEIEELKGKRKEVEQYEAIIKRYEELKPLLEGWTKNIFGNVKLEPLIANYDNLQEQYKTEVNKLRQELSQVKSYSNGYELQFRVQRDKVEKLEQQIETARKVQTNQVAMMNKLEDKLQSTLTGINNYHEKQGVDLRYYFNPEGKLSVASAEEYKKLTQREEKSQNRGNSNQMRM